MSGQSLSLKIFSWEKYVTPSLVALLVVAAIINLFGVFGPEPGFDALWYHLTIPKLYLTAGKILHLPGGLLYYSEMPRLTETVYIPLLKYLGVSGPHLLNWLAGLGTTAILYLISRKYLDLRTSLLTCCLFYVTPLVSWLSGSAYIDLIRTFWELAALYLISQKRLLLAGLLMGLAVSAKTLALGSLVAAIPFAYLTSRNWREVGYFLITAIIVGLPWYLLAYLYTGYPFYPIGSGILDTRHTALPQILNPLSLLGDFWKLSLLPEDPVSPIYLLLLPFLLLNLRKIDSRFRPWILYGLLGYLAWWITPRLGGGRFILPYLPVFALLSADVISRHVDKIVKIALIASVLAIGLLNIFYRLGAEVKLLPLFLGKETSTQFLCRNLDFKIGTFVDCDGWFDKNIKPTDLVLVAGTHNLFYVNFPFVHQSMYQGEQFNYVLTQGVTWQELLNQNNGIIARTLSDLRWHVIYSNSLTGVKVYHL